VSIFFLPLGPKVLIPVPYPELLLQGEGHLGGLEQGDGSWLLFSLDGREKVRLVAQYLLVPMLASLNLA